MSFLQLHQQATKAAKARSLVLVGLVAFMLGWESHSLPAAEEALPAKETLPAEPGEVAAPTQHFALIFSAQFSPDGKRIVTASKDGTARLWDAASGNPIGEPMQSNEAVCAAEFSPNGKSVVTASVWDARVWDAATGKPTSERMKHDAAVVSAHFSPDGQRVLTASSDGTARLWDAVGVRI